MLLLLTAALASQPAVVAAKLRLAPTPTIPPRFAAVFPRQTGPGFVDSPECSSALDSALDMPTPPPDLSSYLLQQAVGAPTNPCAISYPSSLTSEASRYQSQVRSWLSEKKDLLTKCPELSVLQSQYSTVCPTTESASSATGGSNKAVMAGSGGSGSLSIGTGDGARGGGGGGGGVVAIGDGGGGGSGGGSGSSGDSSLSGGAIVGIVIGVLIGLGVLAGIMALLIRRGRRRPGVTSRRDLTRQQQPSQTFNKGVNQIHHPREHRVHEMPQPRVKPPTELMGNTEAPPVEMRSYSEPVYEMLAEHRPNMAAAPNLGYKSGE